ncbi:hypothetical protein HX882_20895 [Pseudomonas gingeri]|uniref:Uncharacterized protein n=1 Tax=Pseudomonas gingeri TaxID=117681 RepID=A0A7Y7XEI0_9PSED|nr:hypothetical protein [Pseudomonas gingeri]NWB98360.1 hypothetical protein [Pseudomonas gingeri]
MNATLGSALTTSKQSNGFVVKNPNQVINSFTIRDKDSAAATLKLNGTDQINQLKDLLKNYDMTPISTNDLAKIGSMLYQNGLIDEQVDSMFISGNNAFDANGQQTDKDVKFNAIAMFNEMLTATQGVAKANPEFAMESQQGYQVALHSLVGANQAINALAYFSNSPHSNLSVSERA